MSNEVAPLPSCQLVSLKLPYIHTSLPLPFTISTKYNICHIGIGKNHHPIGGRLICEWEYRWELSSHQVEDLRTGVSLCEYNCPSPSLDGRSYVHIEWPRQLLPSHCIASPLESYIITEHCILKCFQTILYQQQCIILREPLLPILKPIKISLGFSPSKWLQITSQLCQIIFQMLISESWWLIVQCLAWFQIFIKS